MGAQGCGRSGKASCKSHQLRRTVCHSSLTTDPERRPDEGATGGPRRTPVLVPAATAGPKITSCSRRARFDALRAAALVLMTSRPVSPASPSLRTACAVRPLAQIGKSGCGAGPPHRACTAKLVGCYRVISTVTTNTARAGFTDHLITNTAPAALANVASRGVWCQRLHGPVCRELAGKRRSHWHRRCGRPYRAAGGLLVSRGRSRLGQGPLHRAQCVLCCLCLDVHTRALPSAASFICIGGGARRARRLPDTNDQV